MTDEKPQEPNENQDGPSELQHLLNLIDLEFKAAQQGFYGFAETAKHQFITARMENMQRFQERIARMIGEDEAIRLVNEKLSQDQQEPKKDEDQHQQ
jgi:hypothetical protein